MEISNWILMTLSGVFGAGSSWATLRTKVNLNTDQMNKLEADVNKKFTELRIDIQNLDHKIDRLVDHLLDRQQH